MIRYIFKSWWRNKRRLSLLLIGALLISSGLSYLLALSETNKGTVEQELQKHWQASYHIVVRPKGSRSSTETQNLMEPNYLSSLSSGISLEQYDKIKKIPGITVAAPVAMIGYFKYHVTFDKIPIEDDGIYRITQEDFSSNGIHVDKDEHKYYTLQGPWTVIANGQKGETLEDLPRKIHEYGTTGSLMGQELPLVGDEYVLLAGIDPEQEAKLVGLDKALLPDKKHAYLPEHFAEIYRNKIPVLFSKEPFSNRSFDYKIEKLAIPYDDPEKTMEMVKNKGGENYLNTVQGEQIYHGSFMLKDFQDEFLSYMDDEQLVNDFNKSPYIHQLFYKTTPMQYQAVDSPFPDRWVFANEIIPQVNDTDSLFPAYLESSNRYLRDAYGNTYRKLQLYDQKDRKIVMPIPMGIFDPSKLNILMDPETELPMETYHPATAKLVLDKNNMPTNPVQTIEPDGKAYGPITRPPSMLTTIEAARKLVGDKPISAIRIKVAGVDKFTEENQQKLEAIAHEIEDKTGLITDITLGSSPQPTLTHIPASGDKQALGWMEQPWIHVGTAVTIFNETKAGFSGVLLCILLVAIVYVITTSMIAVLLRKKEFGLLQAVGWQPSKFTSLVLLESFILALFVTVIAWLMNLYFYGSPNMERWLFIATFSLIIYGMGAFLASWYVRRFTPLDALKTGEVAAVSKRYVGLGGRFGLVFNSLLGKGKRNLFSILSIALPTSMLTFFFFITFKLKGVMYITWLGQYIAYEVTDRHVIALIAAILISILTTGEIIWQNVSERQTELSLLKALGWRNRSLYGILLAEGIIIGLIAGVIGLSIGMTIIFKMYHQLPWSDWEFFILVGLIPMAIGLIGSLIPAFLVVKKSPGSGIRE